MGVFDITIQDVIQRNAILYSDEVGYVEGDTRWTFSQYAQEVDRLASGLRSLDMEKGNRIAALAFNSLDYLLLYGAAARLGLIMVPMNWRLKADEIQVILESSTPKAMVAGPEYMETAAELSDRCPFVKHWLAFGEWGEGFLSLRALADQGRDLDNVELSNEDPLVIIHTAAVEGRPKGAVLTHGNLVMGGIQAMALMGIGPDSVHLSFLPYFHIGGLGMTFRVMSAGGRNVIMARFDPLEAVHWIDKEQVTVLQTFAPILSNILEAADASHGNLTSLEIVSGLDRQETIRRCQEMTGARFWTVYGQTETTGACTSCPFDDRPGSAGKAGPLVRVAIVDDYDREVSVGQVGEIIVRGPLIFQKYWNMEEETAYTLRGGWHHTGDMGRMDEKGYLWYVKRKPEKELIKPGGENVYPAEVERVLVQHQDVLEACVFGIPDRQWGEAVKAVCVRKEGSSLESQTLIDFVADHIARYKKPQKVVFVDELPRDKKGAIDREQVKKMFT